MLLHLYLSPSLHVSFHIHSFGTTAPSSSSHKTDTQDFYLNFHFLEHKLKPDGI